MKFIFIFTKRYKNGSKLKPDARYISRVEENTFYLTLTNIKANDQGKIKCVLKNKVGQLESKEATLVVTSPLYLFSYFNIVLN